MTDAAGTTTTSLVSRTALLSLFLGSNHNSPSSSVGGPTTTTTGTAFHRTPLGRMAASAGLSFVILRFVLISVVKAADKNKNSNHGNTSSGGAAVMMSQLLSRSEVLYQFLRTIFRRVILQENITKGGLGHANSDRDDFENSEEDGAMPIIHIGSCHCQSVCFELIAPRKVICKEALSGKIQFRHARVRARSFRFVKGTQFVKMYYVNESSKSNQSKTFRPTTRNSSNNNDDEVGAHSFCSRCGVHFLHAPNSQSSALDVNVDCFNPDDIKLQVVPISSSPPPIKSSINLFSGSPVMGQWEEQEHEKNSHQYPATISEENSPVVILQKRKSRFTGYRHHPLLRHQSDGRGFDTFDNDDDTIDIPLHGGDKGVTPDTPSTVHTSQTESFLSSSRSGVPPTTLSLDTRDCNNDTDSVVSLSSPRSCFLALNSHSSGLQNVHSSAKSSSTTPLVQRQMQYYTRKHLSSTSSLSSSSKNNV